MARDRVVKGWNFAENLGDVDADYGSGYPNGNNPQLSIYLSMSSLSVSMQLSSHNDIKNYEILFIVLNDAVSFGHYNHI